MSKPKALCILSNVNLGVVFSLKLISTLFDVAVYGVNSQVIKKLTTGIMDQFKIKYRILKTDPNEEAFDTCFLLTFVGPEIAIFTNMKTNLKVIIDSCPDFGYRYKITKESAADLYLKCEYDTEKKYIPEIRNLQFYTPIKIKSKEKIYDFFIPYLGHPTELINSIVDDIIENYSNIRLKVGMESFDDFINSIAETRYIINFGQIKNSYVFYYGLSCKTTSLISIPPRNSKLNIKPNIHYYKIDKIRNLLDIISDLFNSTNIEISRTGYYFIQQHHNLEKRSSELQNILNEFIY